MLLSRAIEEAKEIDRKLYVSGRKINDDFRSKLACSCFAISLQHHHAILILLSNKPPLHASALALLRLLVEACLRGLWLSHVATDEQIEVYPEKGTKMNMARMMQSLDGVTGLTAYQSIYKAHWSALSSYSHTGELQVQRWLTTQDIEPNYSEDEILELIKLSSLTANLTLAAIAAISSER